MSSEQQEDNMDRDQQLLSRLAKIQHKVDSIEQTLAFSLRAEADKHFASIKAIFGASRRMAQVYLACDGVRSVQEIAVHLGMQRQNVGKELSNLAEEGLLEVIGNQGNRTVWAKKSVDRTLRISKFLQEEFDLQSDGLPIN